MPLMPVCFVGAGPGDPDLLTIKALKALQEADVIIHDRLVSAGVLALAGHQARLVDVGKEGFGPSTPQAHIDALNVKYARQGLRVVRLKGGDCTIFGRLDEEIEALEEAGLPFHIVPGITAASAAVAGIGQSLTRRGRNASARIITGHDMKGFADQDWRALAQHGEVTAIYMGKKAARFIQGRLLMHGAAPDTPVTVVENASRGDQRVLASTLADLPATLDAQALNGPALLLYGLAPRDVADHPVLAREVS
jgi:uroporphyrin-III C-methyltransferase